MKQIWEPPRWAPCRACGGHRLMSECNSSPGQNTAVTRKAFWFSMGQLGHFIRGTPKMAWKIKPAAAEASSLAGFQLLLGNQIKVRAGHLQRVQSRVKAARFSCWISRALASPLILREEVRRWWKTLHHSVIPSRAFSADEANILREVTLTTQLHSVWVNDRKHTETMLSTEQGKSK